VLSTERPYRVFQLRQFVKSFKSQLTLDRESSVTTLSVTVTNTRVEK